MALWEPFAEAWSSLNAFNEFKDRCGVVNIPAIVKHCTYGYKPIFNSCIFIEWDIRKLMCFFYIYIPVWSSAIHGSWMVNHYVPGFWTIPFMSISRSNWCRHPSMYLCWRGSFLVWGIVASGERLPTLVGARSTQVVASDVMFPSDVPIGHWDVRSHQHAAAWYEAKLQSNFQASIMSISWSLSEGSSRLLSSPINI